MNCSKTRSDLKCFNLAFNKSVFCKNAESTKLRLLMVHLRGFCINHHYLFITHHAFIVIKFKTKVYSYTLAKIHK